MTYKDFKLIELKSQEISSYIDSIARLRIEVFKEYPYLYRGSLEYEMAYLHRYVRSKNSYACLALKQDELIGVTTCILLCDEDKDFRKPLESKGYDAKKTVYFGESIIRKNNRGQGLGKHFFQKREQYAKSFPGVKNTCFCSVDREDDDPRKPQNYRSPETLWKRLNYQKDDDMKAHYRWSEINGESDIMHSLSFWVKELDRG